MTCIVFPASVDPICFERGRDGMFRKTKTPMQRFVDKCQFDPRTGCVEWIGGTTTGQGKSALYGSFWFEGRRWFAHRWAAKFIHGLEIEGLDVDHECRNTICVQHLQAVTPEVNRELVWIRREVGLEEYPPPDWFPPADDAIPFEALPNWIRPYVAEAMTNPPF